MDLFLVLILSGYYISK